MSVVDAASQDLHCRTDPNCSLGTAQATEKQLNQLLTNPFSSPPAN
jgi:hypothetical protein